jgi:PAS domain S-box-containing protein
MVPIPAVPQAHRADPLRLGRALLGGYAIAGGLITLIGWAAGIDRLMDWINSGITMKANPAICAVGAGVALIVSLESARSRAARNIVVALGLCTALIGGLTLAEHITGWNFGLDTLLFYEPPGMKATFSPGRMGVPAATSFLLIGSALILLQGDGRRHGVAAALGMAVAAIALLSIVGNIYGAEQTYTRQLTGIALQTATIILALGLGLVCSVAERGVMRILLEDSSAGVLVRRALPIVIGLPVLLGGVRVIAQEQGWVDTALGTAIRTIIEMGLLSALLLWTARAVRLRESLLRDSEAGKSGAFKAALDCIISIDHAGKITEFNPAAERTFGYRRQDVLGRELATLLIPTADRQRHRDGLARYLETGDGPILDRRVELTALRADGMEFPIEMSVSMISTAGPPVFTAFLRDISARKLAEAQIRRSQETFFNLIERAPFGIYTVDAEFRIAHVNSGAQSVFANVRPLIGRDLAEAIRIIWPEPVAGEVIGAFRRTLDAGEPYYSPGLSGQRQDVDIEESYEWSLHRVELADGQLGVVCYFFDATKLQQAKQALRDSELRYRRLFEATKDGVVILDADTAMIVDANDFMTDLTGLDRASLVGKQLHEIGMFQDADESEKAFAQLRRDSYIHYEHLTIQNQRGEMVAVEVVANVYHEEHRLVAQCNIRDISERMALQRRIAAQAEDLADESRRKDEFLAMLSHELRNPLAAVMNAAELLRLLKNDDSAQQRACSIIERQAGQLAHLIDDLLEVSRITTGRIVLRAEPVDVKAVVEHAVETIQPVIEQRRHTLAVLLPAQAIWLNADVARLEQVLVNLLNNAAKYTEEGGQIWLTVQPEGDTVVLRVKDTGIGIAAELLPHIFDLFRQADRSLDRSEGGLGIGLSVVQRLVALHRGTVAVNSVLGEGSEFVVRLPVIATAAPEPPSPAKQAGERTGSALRVLVVDDNVPSADTMAMLMKELGHDVRTAYDGPKSLETAIAYRPDVVLLDIGLPGMNGYDVAKRLRQEPDLQDIVLIAVTGYGQASDRQHSQAAGFDHHLVKPADITQVEQILATVSEDKTRPGGIDGNQFRSN